jgi:hypothetical protein
MGHLPVSADIIEIKFLISNAKIPDTDYYFSFFRLQPIIPRQPRPGKSGEAF